MTAPYFLDAVYDEPGNGGGRFSRAATPAMVRESHLPPLSPKQTTHRAMPGAFPSLNESESSNTAPSRPSMQVFDRLYPSLAKYQAQPSGTSATPRVSFFDKSPTKSPGRFRERLTNRLSRLTTLQETSFLSTGVSSKRYMPRVSQLPQSPSIDDVDIEVDSTAEYAIVVSMYEVYNDRIFDLLTASAISGKPLTKRRALLFKSTEHSPDRKVVAGLRKVVCSSLDEALVVLETGLQERRVAGTGSNAVSSRSHGFFCIEVKKRHRAMVPGPWSSSAMTIVDLAGELPHLI